MLTPADSSRFVHFLFRCFRPRGRKRLWEENAPRVRLVAPRSARRLHRGPAAEHEQLTRERILPQSARQTGEENGAMPYGAHPQAAEHHGRENPPSLVQQRAPEWRRSTRVISPLAPAFSRTLREVRGIEAGAAWEVVERVQAREALHSFGRRAHRLRCLVNLVGAATGNEQRTTHFPYDVQSSGTSGCSLAIHIPASAKANSLIMRQ